MKKQPDPELWALRFMCKWFDLMPSRSAQARSIAFLANRFSDEAADLLYRCSRQFREEEEREKAVAPEKEEPT